MTNRSCLGSDTMGCSTSSMQLSPLVKSPKVVVDGATGTKSLYNSSEVDQLGNEKQDLRVPVYVINMRYKRLSVKQATAGLSKLGMRD